MVILYLFIYSLLHRHYIHPPVMHPPCADMLMLRGEEAREEETGSWELVFTADPSWGQTFYFGNPTSKAT